MEFVAFSRESLNAIVLKVLVDLSDEWLLFRGFPGCRSFLPGAS